MSSNLDMPQVGNHAAPFSHYFSSPVALVLCLLMGLGLFTFFNYNYYQHVTSKGDKYFIQDQPVMATNDAYYYLNQSRQLLESGGGVRTDVDYQAPFSGLSILAYRLSQSLDIDLHRTAFFLPPLLALTMLAPFILFGLFIKRPLAGLLAFIASQGSLYWMARTRLGYFDTDCLNPFFFLATVLVVFGFTRGKGLARLVWLALFLVLCAAANVWWPQMRNLVLALGFGGYALSLPFPSSILERAIKVLLLLLAGIVALDLAGAIHVLPANLDVYLHNFKQHLAFLFGQNNSGFLPTASFISELSKPDLASLQEYLVFFIPSFITACLGAVLLFVEQPRLGVHLLPILAIGLLSFFFYRFLIFLVPLLAMGQGYGLSRLLDSGWASRFFPSKKAYLSVACLAAAFILLAPIVKVIQFPLSPNISAEQYKLAQKAEQSAQQDAVIWCWWDYGYFLHYVTRLPVVAHGGTMDADFLLMNAAPLATSNPATAANWMRFIAEREVFGFRFVEERLHSPELSRDFLKEAFTQPQDIKPIMDNFGVTEPASPDWWHGYLFPNRPVLLYLDPTMLHKSNRWFDLGTWNFQKGIGVSPDFYNIPDPETCIYEENCVVMHGWKDGFTLPVLFSESCLLDESGLHCITTQEGTYGSLIRINDVDVVYFLGPGMRHSLVAKLLLFDPLSTPGFEPVYYHPMQGGWWQVKPMLQGLPE